MPSGIGCEWLYQRCYLHIIRYETIFQQLHLFDGDERFVALYVDHDIECFGEFGVGFVAAVGAGAVCGSGHNGASAEVRYSLSDAFVVGGYHYRFEYLRCAFVHVLNHRFTKDIGQRFSGKSGRCVSCRDDAYKFHVLLYIINMVYVFICARD